MGSKFRVNLSNGDLPLLPSVLALLERCVRLLLRRHICVGNFMEVGGQMSNGKLFFLIFILLKCS